METIEKETELEINNGKFYVLENRADEKTVQRFIYVNIKPAIDRLKDLIKSVNTDKLSLSIIDMTGTNWNITGIPWALITMGIIRGDVSKETLDSIIESVEKAPNTSQKKK